MHVREDISVLPANEIEDIEKLTLRWIFQAFVDFGRDPKIIFANSPDHVTDIAEDITREVLDKYAGNSVNQRIFGTVDYKKARYIILPEQIVRQALFVDSKAEKDGNKARLQVSQIPMNVKQIRNGVEIEVSGGLPPVSIYNQKQYLTTVVLIHYYYTELENTYLLREITIAGVPNGILQDKYNPDFMDTIWDVGPDAPTRGESFRTRLSFRKLLTKAPWRVQKILFDNSNNITAEWKQ